MLVIYRVVFLRLLLDKPQNLNRLLAYKDVQLKEQQGLRVFMLHEKWICNYATKHIKV